MSSDADRLLKEFPRLVSILQDVDSRFILNLEERYFAQPAMIFFKIQKAHWFYEDKFDTELRARELPHIGLERFGRIMIETSALLSKYISANKRDQYFDEWREYMRRIPRLGAIILNPEMTAVLMVQAYGGKKNWQFPRGKLNSDESHVEAAAREVMEECGVDVSSLLREDRFIERRIDGTLHKLFIAYPLSQSVALSTRTKKEIEAIEWVPVKDLPKPNGSCPAGLKFFAVFPFVDSLRHWIKTSRSYEDEGDEAFKEGGEVPLVEADRANGDTFDGDGSGGWSFDAMLEANKKLGYKSDFESRAAELYGIAVGSAEPSKTKKNERKSRSRATVMLEAFDLTWNRLTASTI